MNKINIQHEHSFDHVSACEKAEHMLDDLASKYGLNIESDGDGQISFSGSGIEGNVEISQNEINFYAKLGFLLTAMKPVISNEIVKKLEKTFT